MLWHRCACLCDQRPTQHPPLTLTTRTTVPRLQLMELAAPQFCAAACSFGKGKKGRARRTRREERREAKAAHEASLRSPTPGDDDDGDDSDDAGDGTAKRADDGSGATGTVPPSGTVTTLDVMPAGASALRGLAGWHLGDGEGARLLRDWGAFKSKSIGRQEGQKDGTGRVCIYR